ncbi:MAG: hypothetical protein P1P69_01880 [Methanosarcinaceae archaeon]|nr:hypothetical protein [Methanosarcinaceae archaeon]
MRSVHIICLIAAVIVLSLTATPACAGFNWENNITVDTHGMTWGYTEQYTEENFVFYKSYIDSDIGNDDGYVSAWELLKVDSITRKSFYDSIMKDMDVRINDSSSNVHLQEIDSSLSEDVLGKVYESGEVINYYKVTYSFDRTLTELGTNIWFLAEPETNMTVTFPAGIEVTSTKGIDNTTIIVHDRIATLTGTVGFEGEVTVGYAENATFKTSAPKPNGNLTSTPDAPEDKPVPQLPYNPVDEILKWLGFDPKR